MNITTRTGRRLAAAIAGCCAVLLPGTALAAPTAQAAPTTPAAPAAAPAHPAPPACETPGLVIWLDTNGNGAAGSVFYNLQFTNLSGHACTLNGFPFISAVSVTGHRLGRRAAFTSKTPHNVTLKEGKTVTAVLQIVDVSNFPAAECKAVTAAGLRVFPPNQTTSRKIPFPFGACSAHKAVFLRVAPVTR